MLLQTSLITKFKKKDENRTDRGMMKVVKKISVIKQ